MIEFVPRFPWPGNFPDVFVQSTQAARDNDPDFPAAKAGDRQAALRLAIRHLGGPNTVGLLVNVKAVLLPVTALETTGFNAIPDAMAHLLGVVSGLPVVSGQVVQANRVGHTRASGWHRLVTPARFQGEVEPGLDYILVDDHIGLGGTLANLRGFVEAGGGRVVAMTTLSETREGRHIAVRPETLAVLRETHGQGLEDLWCGVFGHGLDCLTDVEAGYLARQLSIDVIRDHMAEAAEQARGRGPQAIEVSEL